MGTNHNPKRRAAGVASAKIIIASASVAATLGGWAAIGAMDATIATPSTQSDTLAQALAPQDSQPETTTPFGRRGNRWGDQREPVPGGDDQENDQDDAAPQMPPLELPGAGDQQPQTLPNTQPQQQLPQVQPQQQQPQFPATPRFRTRSSR